MAQTIALQRGAVTMSHNTTTSLFTNTSSGTSTRMMVGYLSYVSDFSSVYGYCTFSILRSGASSPNYSIFAASYPGGAARTIGFSPHDTTTGWHGNSGSAQENNPVFLNQGQAGLLAAFSLSQTNPIKAMYISDVMLGPSDAVYCSWFDNGGGNRSAVVQYCLVLVTE